tara:strand:- start:3623 stop:4402 length:780 start_codon:yes stop_codon:yes gene_type:complete
MKVILFVIIISSTFASCSFKNQLTYFSDHEKNDNLEWLDYSSQINNIESGDILKIDVITAFPQASFPYNKNSINGSSVNQNNLEIIKLEGYSVDVDKNINFPVLGKISVENLNETQLEERIAKLLVEGKHLTDPVIKVTRINNKFTVLGEVKSPGTYSYIDANLNVLQALGYAGGITVDGKKNNVTVVREENGKRNIYTLSLTKKQLLSSPIYNTKNNDIIVINPTFSKIKSSGFIGNPSSIASMASLLLSITLLITNK